MEPDYKTIFLQLCASLTQADHMGAAWEDVGTALRMAGLNVGAGGGADEIGKLLAGMNVTTLGGTALNEVYEPYYQ